jgi:hypothetical protein
MLRRIFKSRREDVTGIVTVVKPRRLSCERHVEQENILLKEPALESHEKIRRQHVN